MTVSVLCPMPMDTAARRARRGVRSIVESVVRAAAINRPGHDLIEQVYLAGLWHGAEIGGPIHAEFKPPRKPDYLDMTPAPKRRGRKARAQDDG